MNAILTVFLLIASVAALPASADVLFESGVRRTIMVELYTSQGCNSCPPAEAYLNSLAGHPKLWMTIIPVAFHVDYWDYLGWKDRFALPENADRQRDHVRAGNATTVYTPALFANGKAFRPHRLSETDVPRPPAGKLQLRVREGQLSASFEPVESLSGPFDLNVALLGMGLTSSILAGENRGRHSRHEFVVLARQRLSGSDGLWQTDLNQLSINGTRAAAVAAWVSLPGDVAPLQAAGGYLSDTESLNRH